MKRVLDDIQTGKFARDWVLRKQGPAGQLQGTRARAAAHPIEEVGARLRAHDAVDCEEQARDTAKN